ncbi:MAG: hypothetical protein IH595_03625 [Bacteroidales bacterium]|nr:hypothetical protein [Bacteroidales bacterium]
MNTQIVHSVEARKAISLGLQLHQCYKVVGQGELPTEPIYKNEWWFETWTTQEIPEEGIRRLEALKKAGIAIKGVIVAHEAPRLLAAEKKVEKKPDFKISRSTDILTFLGSLASVFVMLAMFVVSAFFQAVLIDPALIVVLKDGTWLEVMTWYE